jgi:molecular chaperone GrpE
MDKDNEKGNEKGKGRKRNRAGEEHLRPVEHIEMEDLGVVGAISPPPELPLELILLKLKQISADYENFRTRSEREKGRMYDLGKMHVVEALLPIIDNFGLALKNADPNDSFVRGILMIQSQFNTLFAEMGVIKIPAVGEIFDIRFHSASSHIQDDEYGEQEIVEEVQAGYVYRDVVIRHSVVVVAN